MIIQTQKVTRYIEEGHLEEGIKETEKLPSHEQEGPYCKIARVYFEQEKFDQAIKTLENSVIRSEIKLPIYKEFAILCCDKEKYDDSIKFIKKISLNDDVIHKFFMDIGLEYTCKDEFAKALFIT